MDSYYIINSYVNGTFVSQTDIFHEKNEITNLKSILDKKSNIQNVIFECKPINDNFKKAILYKYLNGYLLVPNKNDPYYEMERLNNGDWCDDVKGWYYNKSELENLEQTGYTIDSKLLVDYSNYEINKLEIYFYNKGFILTPKKTYKYYGQKYLLGGKWIPEQKGWYFKNMKKHNKFTNMGAFDHVGTFME